MSRDKRLNRTQEVVGSIPISSTEPSMTWRERPAQNFNRAPSWSSRPDSGTSTLPNVGLGAPLT